MDETLRRMGLDKARARKGAVRPQVTGEDLRRMLADVGTSMGVPFIDAAQQAAQGNYGQAAISGLLDAPPVKMAGMALAPMIGMVKSSKAAPMDEALRIAQKNAAKPVSEGGLGLPKNNTPMDRARAMGFDLDTYHGSPAVFRGDSVDFASRKNRSSSKLEGFYSTEWKDRANDYAESLNGRFADGAQVLPLKTRMANTFDVQSSAPATQAEKGALFNAIEYLGPEGWAKSKMSGVQTKSDLFRVMTYAGVAPEQQREMLMKLGYQTAKDGHEKIALNPSMVRSRFAAFDPARINENNLLASLAALGISIPVMRGLLQEEEMQ